MILNQVLLSQKRVMQKIEGRQAQTGDKFLESEYILSCYILLTYGPLYKYNFTIRVGRYCVTLALNYLQSCASGSVTEKKKLQLLFRVPLKDEEDLPRLNELLKDDSKLESFVSYYNVLFCCTMLVCWICELSMYCREWNVFAKYRNC